MAGEKQSLKDLKKCMKDAHGDPALMADCETRFGQDPDGTIDGGKVFSTPDGNGAFVTTGGKVFGGKVF